MTVPKSKSDNRLVYEGERGGGEVRKKWEKGAKK